MMPECYVDTNLIEYLLDAHVNHQHSCTKVIGNLKNSHKDKFAIGIIDRDKKLSGYLEECDEIASTKHLTLLKHKSRNHYIITIKPAVDGFILDCALERGVKPEDYGLPSKLQDFTKESKSVTSNSDNRFKKLFKALINNSEFRNLRESLKYLIDNTFSVDLKILKDIFEKL
ncbi:MAG: hypothetical protein K2M00_04885 [Muribaculaceae bacterium]|nr:hypothetical protein [Muribaculaceae bacterium]